MLWVPEGNLAGNFRADFRQNFGQTWPPNPSRSTGLVLQCRLHHKSAPQTNILRPFRGTNNFRPDCLQVPRCPCNDGKTFYCDSVCQRRHWLQHRRVCAFGEWRLAVREVAHLGRLDEDSEARLFAFLVETPCAECLRARPDPCYAIMLPGRKSSFRAGFQAGF